MDQLIWAVIILAALEWLWHFRPGAPANRWWKRYDWERRRRAAGGEGQDGCGNRGTAGRWPDR